MNAHYFARYISLTAISLILGTVLLSAAGSVAQAATPPCRPCAGIVVDDPLSLMDSLGTEPRLSGEARLYTAWPAALDGSADTAVFARLRELGATPWAVLELRTPAPVLDNIQAFDAELQEIARLAAEAGDTGHFQITWPGAGSDTIDPEQYAFVLKRAAVAVTGAAAEARVISASLPPDEALLRALYAQDVAAYLDGVALSPATAAEQEQALAVLTELDPGKPVVLDDLRWPEPAERTLALAAEASRQGFAVTFFRAQDGPEAADLAPLKVLAQEFQGDLSFDPYSVPEGGAKAWSFVRGEDLALRVIVETQTPPGAEDVELSLRFPDPQLRSPERVNLSSGQETMLFGQQRSADGLGLSLQPEGQVTLLRLERMSAAELEGLEAEVDVATERQLPVEEILRRLQAFEDNQARRLQHYQATNTQHLRFRLGQGADGVEVTFEGDFFFERDEGFDWAWQRLYISGVQWKGDRLPEIPLIQPEKASARPLEINFTREYRYRLRGSEITEGRDCWVVDFAPVEVQPGSGLYQGTVWIDRELYARVKTRALQVGLQGEVISNEETTFFSPVGADGQPAEWSADAYYLPLRIVGQQLLSLLNSTTQVDKETLLTSVRINGDDFAQSRQAAYDSESTMVRDTAEGLRYLVKDDSGERVVKEGFDTNRFFLLGGVFYDDSLDFPVPLAGVNYLDLDFRGSGNQVNIFFAGALLTANIAEPRLFGSRWDAGANLFGFFIPTGEELFRGDQEIEEEEVETSNARLALFLGRPLGNFTKLDFTYALEQDNYSRADDTAEDFVLPQDTLTQSFQVDLSYSRSAWRLGLQGSFNKRDDWQFWGLPGNDEFDPEHEDYIRWSASVSKTWYLKRFTQLGIEVEHLNGDDLDRFSKYDFSFFSDASVNGYPSGRVRASEADGIHITYGLNIAETYRIELEGDAVWATDDDTNLDRELLAGIGLEGSLIGPWNTLLNFSVGVPVAGPADGFTARIVFLKLFGS